MKPFKTYLPEFRTHFADVSKPNEDFADFAGAYRLGLALRDDHPRYSWLEVEQTAIERWVARNSPQPWERVSLHVRFAFNCAKERVSDGCQGIAG